MLLTPQGKGKMYQTLPSREGLLTRDTRKPLASSFQGKCASYDMVRKGVTGKGKNFTMKIIGSNEQTVAALAEAVGGHVVGDGKARIHGIASVESADGGDVAFVQDAKFADAARSSAAGCLIVGLGQSIADRCCIEVAQPKLAFARIAALLHPPRFRVGEHQSAHVAETAELRSGVFVGAFASLGERTFVGESTQIYEGVRIGDDVMIGKCCIIHPNVVIYDNVVIGNDVVLHAGAVIGAAGFGYVRDDQTGEYVQFPQTGTVVIEDDVEIGAGSCVDRAALAGETRIGRGTKIDNLVQIGHNVSVGERVVIASQTGISGSTVIEDDCIIGGQVGMGDHARVERGAIIGSKAGVLPGKIVRGGGAVYWGVPVRPLAEYKIMNAHMGRLPQMKRELDRLREQVNALEARREQEAGDVER